MPMPVKVARNLIWIQATIALLNIVLLFLALFIDSRSAVQDLLYAPIHLPALLTGLLANKWHTRQPRLRLATIAVQLVIPVLDVIEFLIDGTVIWVISAPCTALIVTLLLLPSAKTWFSTAPWRVAAPG
ncbi:hypothetical protein AB0K12_25645 [Nonomuraea sp. NPDC049419]|uniref:hypothetical protein n=1 Tax=Nonomuraea sp. NPDC049419 TaxID=3155772 RepID=UPI003434E99F